VRTVALCFAAEFYPRDAMLAQIYAMAILSLCSSVHLSVCVLHVCLMSKIKMT